MIFMSNRNIVVILNSLLRHASPRGGFSFFFYRQFDCRFVMARGVGGPFTPPLGIAQRSGISGKNLSIICICHFFVVPLRKVLRRMKGNNMDTPEFVKRDGIIADSKYVEWLSSIKQRYQRSQIKAAVQVNHTMLEFYWELGRDIVALKAESQWGSGFFKQLSLDLREMFPDKDGFSVTNLKYIKRWYLFYYEHVINRQQLVDDFGDAKMRQHVTEFGQQVADELGMPANFALVPWFHHVAIISKSKSLDEALFYINEVIAGNWSRSRLEDELKSDLFARQGKAITNFSKTLELPQPPYDPTLPQITYRQRSNNLPRRCQKRRILSNIR